MVASVPNQFSPDPAPGMPCWVKIFGIIAIVPILVVVILHLTGVGPHSHAPSGFSASHATPSGVTEHGVR